MTTTIPRPNRNAISEAIDIYRDAMRPFIMRGLKRVRGMNAEQAICAALPNGQYESFRADLRKPNASLVGSLDIRYFVHIIRKYWQEVFTAEFQHDRSVQNRLWLILQARNNSAHVGDTDIDSESTIDALFQIAFILGRINAPTEREAVRSISARIAPARTPAPVVEFVQFKPRRNGGKRIPIKPWREVIKPNQDIQQGRFQQAEFAADLQQVYSGDAEESEYGNPVNFFQRTHITPGLRTLLTNTLKRLSGNGGDPVIQTKTGFGGGKTHSLIALFHLARDAEGIVGGPENSDSTKAIREIIEDSGMNPDNPDSFVSAAVSVLDGSYLADTDPYTTERGDPLNTLWGVMAYQLGGQEGYDLIGDAARLGTAPSGRQLDTLFEHVGPCLILIDELVRYAGNASSNREYIYAFVQNLTQAARRRSNVAVVVTLIQNAIEAGGPAGEDALARLDTILGRIEAVWHPLRVDEAFEVVRRRLFGDVIDEDERAKTCEAFSRMYTQRRADYPQRTAERRYLERMKSCYPIHPEVFDRLYEDWSLITSFQQTRGVLRMMAVSVSRLYRDDNSPLIMPGSLPLSDPGLSGEFSRCLPGNWSPVLTEVDSHGSRADGIDSKSARFQEVGGAARRIARTVFLGSPNVGAVRGIDARSVNLGVVMPGQGAQTYRDALSEMTEELHYLYSSDRRYYFHAEENLNKVAVNRAGDLTNDEVDDQIKKLLGEAVHSRYRIRAVVCPDSPSDVQDTDETRLVVLSPSQSLSNRASETDDASPVALEFLKSRGEGRSRHHRNMLLFLTAKKDDIRNLRTNVRQYMAWRSIINGDRRIQNLSGDRLNQAQESLNNADRATGVSLIRAYRWALNPVQPDPQDATRYEIGQRLIDTPDADFVKNALDKFITEEVLVTEISPSALSNILGQHIWSNDAYADHIPVNTLWDLMSQHVYMTRLDGRATLIDCIRRGVQEGRFGVAPSAEEDYAGIKFQEAPQDDMGGFNPIMLVEPGTAAIAKEVHLPPADQDDRSSHIHDNEGPFDPDDECDFTSTARGPRQIVASKTSQSDISLDDVSQLRDEIIRTLREDGGDVTVEIIVRADKPDGFSERIAQAVRENGIQLGVELKQSP